MQHFGGQLPFYLKKEDGFDNSSFVSTLRMCYKLDCNPNAKFKWLMVKLKATEKTQNIGLQ